MNQILQSLQEISTGYSVFEKDQVLTHDQLNTVADYCDDQTRLTRVKLLGVGVLCGLRVSGQEASLTVSGGAGVTTDGDLLYLRDDTVFDQFKVYDDSSPKYAPFSAALKAREAYELMPKAPAAQRDPRAHDLSEFEAETGNVLDEMVAVLFMEGYVKDEDLCTGTDCDNLGQNFVSTIKLLVLDKSFVGALNKTIPNSDRAARLLADVVADRPLIPEGVNSTAKLAAIYRAACQNIHKNLALEFGKLNRAFWASFGERFPSDTATGWAAQLNKIRAAFTSSDSGIQYYYDFLKDLAETYNRFRALLFGDSTWCCPEEDSFPKHLLLGNVAAGLDPEENRTPFYFSPLASRTIDHLDHAAFLARKLDALLQAFTLPPTTGIRITPSRFEDTELEERAIPYYYPVVAAHPIQQSWSYRLHKQGMSDWNYSYHAPAYQAQGGAARPLTSQMGCFSFFRIEGHLNEVVSTAQAAIETEIKTNNLPFSVRAVLLGVDQGKVVRKPGIRYSDLHRFHHVLRKDLAYQLDDVKALSTHYADQVNKALTPDDVDNLPQVKIIAGQKDQAISDGVLSAGNVLNQKYSSYKTNAAWKPGLKDTLTAAAEFKQNLGQVTKTEFTTPFDSLIGTSHANWLDWLDIHIQDKDDKEDKKLLFSNFQSAHPALEHFGGVVRGGTFILVYDGNNRVVADFMLPYYYSEQVPEEEPQEPVLPLPPIRNPGVILGGIKLTPSPDMYLAGKLAAFTRDEVEPRINVQKDQVNVLKDSFTTMASVVGGAKINLPAHTNGIKFSDGLLDAAVNEAKMKQREVELLKEKAIDPGLSQETRDRYAELAKGAEAELAVSIQDTARYVADSGTDVSAGSEGFVAMTEMSKSLGGIRDAGALASAKKGLNDVKNSTANADLKVALEGMTRF